MTYEYDPYEPGKYSTRKNQCYYNYAPGCYSTLIRIEGKRYYVVGRGGVIRR